MLTPRPTASGGATISAEQTEQLAIWADRMRQRGLRQMEIAALIWGAHCQETADLRGSRGRETNRCR
jgi:hypothetical protein